MPTLRFKFAKENANLIQEFMLNLDNQAETFDIEEKQNFTDQRFADPINSRNSYLNRWNLYYHLPWKQEGGRTTM